MKRRALHRRYGRSASYGSTGFRAQWIAEMAEILQREGYAAPTRNAAKLFAEGYGPDEVSYRARTGQITQLGIPRVRQAQERT
jgi:hypothetical protein